MSEWMKERESVGGTILKDMMFCREEPAMWTMPSPDFQCSAGMSQTQMGLVPQEIKMWVVAASTHVHQVSSVGT